MHQRAAFWGLILIISLAIAVRIYGIGNACYWLDEFDSLECSTGRGLVHEGLPINQWLANPGDLTSLRDAPPWPRIWTSMDLDNHPPLYFILLRWWRDAFGDSEIATRMLSAIFSVSALVLFYLALRQQMSVTGALWGAALMSVAGSQVHFAQETRGYSLWLALAMLAAFMLLRIANRGSTLPRLSLLATACLAMLLTHYFAIATLASLLLYALVRLRGRSRTHTVAAILIACLAFAAVWGPFLWRQRMAINQNNLWQFDTAHRHIALTLARLAALPVRWFSEYAANKTSDNFLVAALSLLGVSLLIWPLRRQAAAAFWIIYALPLALLVGGIDLMRHARYLELTRYTFVAAPGLFALIALSVTAARRAWAVAVPAAIFAICLFAIPTNYSDDQDWRRLAAAMQADIKPGDRIVYYTGGREFWWAGAMHLGISHYAPDLTAQVLLLTDPAAPGATSALQPGHTTWLLCSQVGVEPTAVFPNAKVFDRFDLPNIGAISRLTKRD